MKKLEFKIDIAASKQKVWAVMFNPKTYKEWVNASWPGAYYEGGWKQGENLKFMSPGQGGTMATLVEHRPYEFILAKHIAVIDSNSKEDRDSEVAKDWIGTTEAYSFAEKNGKTKLKVEINTNPEWEKMFTDGWPNALAKLKEVCES
jgi:uncharacterized protein YndB with AHSA1/START domain